MSRNVRRLNFDISTKIADRVDEYAESLGISRSAAIAVIISRYFEQIDAIHATQQACNVIQSNEKKDMPQG